jgi:hypothetical protein
MWQVVFLKLEKLGISKLQLILAIQLTVYGFTFYLIAPILFFYERIDLFLGL